MEVQILLNYQLKNEVSQANFNNYKRIYNWQPFMKRVYEMKNNCWLFEMLFKIQENGAFLLEMSLFVLKIQRILHGREDMNFMFEWQEPDIVFATIT